MVTALDDEIGRVVNAREKKRIRNNTMILFDSDNGANSMTPFAFSASINS